MAEVIKGIVKHRYDTVANYASGNPVLLAGEMGIESTTGRIKFGDGSTAWNSLDYSVSEIVSTATDTTITAVEGKQYLVKNTDSSSHTVGYGSNSTTLLSGYTGIFYYANASWVCGGAFNEDGDFRAGGNISASGTISGAVVTPILYEFYDQEPQTPTPASLYSGTSWENVSERALFYHLAASSGGAETDVVVRDLVEHDNGSGTWAIDKEYAFADLVYDDVIGGAGTHAGKYIIAVDNYSGMSRRYEGGLAETFESGTQEDTFQNWQAGFNGDDTGDREYWGKSGVRSQAISVTSAANFTYPRFVTTAQGDTYGLVPKNNGTDGDPRTSAETRAKNYTIKKWRRTA